MYVAIPKKYQSTASLWALQRYQVIGATGTESNLAATPATTQATALTELLQTRSFVLTVVQGIDLVPTLGLSNSVISDPQQLQDAIFSEISKNVVVTAQDYNLYKLTYENRDAHVAQQILQSVIAHYRTQSQAFSVAEGKNLLASYQSDLHQAQQNDNAAVAAETQYLASHPKLDPATAASDPQYAQLDAIRQNAEINVKNIQASIDGLQQSLRLLSNGENTLYSIIDQPQLASRPLSRLKDYLIGGGGGVGVALLASVLFLVILVRRDRTIYSAYDLGEESIDVPVVMQIPHLKPALVSLVVLHETDRQPLAISSKSASNGHIIR